jgi:TorA maturation chaperone TorD
MQISRKLKDVVHTRIVATLFYRSEESTRMARVREHKRHLDCARLCNDDGASLQQVRALKQLRSDTTVRVARTALQTTVVGFFARVVA